MERIKPLQAVLCLSPLVPALLLPGLGALVSLLIVILALIFVVESRQPTLALRYQSTVRSIAIGALFGLLVAISFDMVVEPFVERLTNDRIDLGNFAGVEGNLAKYLVLMAVGLLFGGIAEELIFRGFVVGWGSAIFGKHAAPWLVLLSAATFGATHIYQGLAGVIATGLIGLLFGLLYLYVGRKLLPAIVAHMIVNAYGITMIYLGLGS